jgi:ceruloplasmin
MTALVCTDVYSCCCPWDVIYQINDETLSHYFEDSCHEFGCARPTKSSGMVQSEDMSSKMHGINGRIYGNLNGLEMNLGENIRWFVAGLGSQVIQAMIASAQTFAMWLV